ncbi:MAG: Hsp20/alpha crystallin family protein [Sulfurifustis sp.]
MAEESKSKQVKPTEKSGVSRAPARGMMPFDEMERMMDRLLAGFVPRGFLNPLAGWRGTLADWEPQMPRVDVLEREDQVVVRAELPGVQKDDLDVAVRDNTLSIKANLQQEEEQQEGDYYRRELRRGAFSRTIELPAEVDGTKAKAIFKDGILELTLPKAEHARAHRVPIE